MKSSNANPELITGYIYFGEYKRASDEAKLALSYNPNRTDKAKIICSLAYLISLVNK